MRAFFSWKEDVQFGVFVLYSNPNSLELCCFVSHPRKANNRRGLPIQIKSCRNPRWSFRCNKLKYSAHMHCLPECYPTALLPRRNIGCSRCTFQSCLHYDYRLSDIILGIKHIFCSDSHIRELVESMKCMARINGPVNFGYSAPRAYLDDMVSKNPGSIVRHKSRNGRVLLLFCFLFGQS